MVVFKFYWWFFWNIDVGEVGIVFVCFVILLEYGVDCFWEFGIIGFIDVVGINLYVVVIILVSMFIVVVDFVKFFFVDRK